jgi:hypothetical protein
VEFERGVFVRLDGLGKMETGEAVGLGWMLRYSVGIWKARGMGMLVNSSMSLPK